MPAKAQRNVREEAAAAGATTLISFVYENLRREIISGKYRPEEKLRVEYIRAGYAVAASTVREALARLVAEGLVTAEGQRGFRVAPMSVDDLRDITRLRMILETEAMVESMRLGDVAWEGKVVAAFHTLSRAEENLVPNDAQAMFHWEECNKEFHQAIISACPSSRLRWLVEILYRQHERYRIHALGNTMGGSRRSGPARNIHAEHEALMKAVIGRDVDAARRQIEEHIQNTARVVEQWLAAQLSGEA
ncbi:MAG: FCD domain-containing protein [Magnetospirillum sp.]|nr:FCD domain-containing protein [Magnetospirillum sp.]